MATMADVKAGFYDAQRQASNMFEVIFSDLAKIQSQLEQIEKENKEPVPSPTEP